MPEERQERVGVAGLVADVDVLRPERALGQRLGNVDGSAVENPPPGSAVHCIGTRTARRPSAFRFSPRPISSP